MGGKEEEGAMGCEISGRGIIRLYLLPPPSLPFPLSAVCKFFSLACLLRPQSGREKGKLEFYSSAAAAAAAARSKGRDFPLSIW